MIAVRFDRVSKQFTLHHERPRSFQELFLSAIKLQHRTSKEKYWVLNDISFEIEHGEMVGIVGPNGAGKSTILKLMSRIIEPTSGQMEVNGRLGALLELGAGFHPDLTGRENVYLNGAFLGCAKSDMDRVFDDILDFSEMERFIDIPVKHYSSGMYMRLGFSIAIHLQPELLLVDEILAVGDRAFQLRCLDRVQELKRQGVTIILVSHDLAQVRDMCDRAIWVEEGQVQAEGPVEPVLSEYMAHALDPKRQVAQSTRRGDLHGGRQSKDDSHWRWGSGEASITQVQFLDSAGQAQSSFETGAPLIVRICFAAHERIEKPQFGLALHHVGGFHISGPNTVFGGFDIDAIEGSGYIDYVIDSLPLLEGTYLVSASLADREDLGMYDYHHQAYTLHVHRGDAVKERYGSILIPATWRMGPTGGNSTP
jgi:ABC-type polysaccharide/polyol phosphate transport system ATPase subunit